MRRVAYSLGGVLLVFVSVLLVVNALYNLCGAFRMQDCADGPVWLNVMITIGLGTLTVAVIWGACRMFRRGV